MDTTDAPNRLKRKRARLACWPCRQRKRKCNGQEPCNTCTEWGYTCHFDAPQAGRATRPTGPAAEAGLHRVPSSVPGSSTAGSDHGGLVRRLEANSGAAFVRKLALRIDPTKAPKLNLFGWNVGARQLSAPQVNADAALPIVEITSCDHIKALAQVYFEKVDRCYGFIDRRQFFERLEARWAPSAVPSIHDSVLCGVAALGCLFSQRSATVTELHLARCARSTLDGHQLSGPPCLDLLTGWTLRTVYLRATSSPHATWVASCTLMHLVEASGLHPESSSAVLLPSAQGDPDLRRRLVGMAHHLNVWTSFDLGLSRVSFQNTDLPPLPSAASPDDYTAELLALLPVSLSLDPGRPKDETDLTSTLSRILAGSHTQPPSVLAQCNLVLCILRRIHTQNLDVSTGLAEQILALLKKGLGCAQELLADCSPWHHVANVPFQIICVLLTLDTRSSLSLLPEAMRTLRLVASTYDTDTMRDAYSTACLLVVLHQQRRKDDLAVLEEVVNTHQPGRQYPSPSQVQIADEDFSWLGALVADMPGLQRIGKSIFLPNAKSFFAFRRKFYEAALPAPRHESHSRQILTNS